MDGEKYTDIDLTVVGEVSDDAFEDFVTLYEDWTEKHGVSPLIAALHPYNGEDAEAVLTLNMAKDKIDRVRVLADQYEAAPDSVQYLQSPGSFKDIVVKELRQAIS